MSFRLGRRWLAAALILSLALSTVSGAAYAAEDTVTGIQWDYDSSDYNTETSSLQMFVEDDKVKVSVLASISGTSSRKDVTSEAVWKTSNSSYVKVDKGLLTGAGKGTATISATYKGFTISIKATSDYVYDKITIMQDDNAAPDVIPDIKLGESLTFTLDGEKDGVATNITSDAVWTTSSASVATVDEGRITLLGVGTATITAKYKGKSDSIKITATSPYKSIAIGPRPSSGLLELEVGRDDTELHATAAPKSGGTLEVTDEAVWTSGNNNILTVDKGVITPVAAGKTTVTVSHLGVTDKLDVVVRTPYQSIKLTPEKEYHMQLHDAPLQIRADVLNNANVASNATDDATWTSSNQLVATVVKGKVTPKAVGTTKITATHKGISRSIDITVYPSITEIKAGAAKLDGYVGITGELPTITAKTFDGSTIDVSNLVKWSVEDEDVATLDKNKWTAEQLGETNLVASVQGFTAEVKLIVHVKPIKLIAESKDSSIVIGKTVNLPKVTVVNEDGEEENVSDSIVWKTTSDNVVLMEKTMRGLEASTATLTGTYLTKSVTVRVKIEEEIVKLVAEPLTLSLHPGRSKSIKVTGHYKSGKTVSLGSKMNWSIQNTAVATTSGTSSIKAVAAGTTKAIGSYQDKTIEITIVVTNRLRNLQMSDKSTQLKTGESYTVALQANYFTGSPIDRTTSAEWTTSKASVATVKNGKITAVGKGTATIKATFEGKSATIRVTVK